MGAQIKQEVCAEHGRLLVMCHCRTGLPRKKRGSSDCETKSADGMRLAEAERQYALIE